MTATIETPAVETPTAEPTVFGWRPDGVTNGDELIGPDEASAILVHNTHNRSVKTKRMLAFARDMKNGNWDYNGESIKIAADGTLLDGQNRLLAIIHSGQTVVMHVFRGLPNQSQETMDRGTSRSVRDILKLRGEAYTNEIGGTISMIDQFRAGSMRRANRQAATASELLAILDEFPWLREEAPFINRVAHRTRLTAAATGFSLWMLMQTDADEAHAFFEKLVDLTNLPEGSPIIALRNVLDHHARNANMRGADARLQAALTIKAWNKWRRGESASQLSWRAGGANPEDFPVPV